MPAVEDAGDTDLPGDLALIVETAQEAGQIAMRFFRNSPEVWMKGGTSPVSEADYAVDRFLRVSGLAGLVRPDDPVVDAGVVAEGSGWRLAQDTRTFGVGVPDMAGLLAAAGCPVVLARGEHDPMVSHDELAALVADPVTLPGLGHNAHVEDPAAVLALTA